MVRRWLGDKAPRRQALDMEQSTKENGGPSGAPRKPPAGPARIHHGLDVLHLRLCKAPRPETPKDSVVLPGTFHIFVSFLSF
jgi:hypothetical protein